MIIIVKNFKYCKKKYTIEKNMTLKLKKMYKIYIK